MRKSSSILQRRVISFFALTFTVIFALIFVAPDFFRTGTSQAEQRQEDEFSPSAIYFENFDGVTAPNLPAGWSSAVNGTGISFSTSPTYQQTAPNSVFTRDPNTPGIGTSSITSNTIALPDLRTQLIFRHAYNTVGNYDGCVLEIKIGDGNWQDIVAAGGVFTTNGYRGVISAIFENPLGGRSGWFGRNSGEGNGDQQFPQEFTLTRVMLPEAARNQTVQFRWIMGLTSVGITNFNGGWAIDDVTIEATQPNAVRFEQNFDGVTAPALPVGWTTSNTGSNLPFVTQTTLPDSQPNAIFTNNPATAGSAEITSPSIPLSNLPSRLIFRHLYSTETTPGFDGGVLEISIGAGAFQDILAAGGSFVNGGYIQAIGSDATGNPLIGRQAWTGSVANYTTTVVNLPLSAANQSIRLRWRFGTDIVQSGIGWRIDNVQILEQAGISIVGFRETFDNVSAPQLPANWTTAITGTGASIFVTSTANPFTVPNSIFTNDPSTVSTSEIVSPPIRVGGNSPKLLFNHILASESGFDGGVLEIKIGNGAFQDIIAAGGSFVSGGYNLSLSTCCSNPLPGRMAWSGSSGNSYITTEVNLPPAAYRQTVQFKWKHGSDNAVGGTGWRIDNVQVTNAVSGENSNAINIPSSGAAQPYPSEIEVTDHTGFVSGVQVFLNNFTHSSPDDVDLVLVSPSGRKVVLMSDVGGSTPVNDLSLLFEDAAFDSLPDNAQLTSGGFKPTDFEPGDAFPAPAPAGAPTGKTLSSLNGTEANGIWKLFLVDDTGNNVGNISGGWSLAIQTSPEVINLPSQGTAQPYPSEINITGQQGTITKVVVTLSNFSHTAPDDADLMLVSPSGRRIILMSDAGGNTEAGGVNLTFDDASSLALPDNAPLTTGTYRPADYEPGDAFPAPAPQGAPTGTTLNHFYGSQPNGVWKLFAVDDTNGNFGSIAGNWSLNIQSSTSACIFNLSNNGLGFPVSGGSGSFDVQMPTGCPWSASTNTSFITLTSGVSGEGNGSVAFTVAPNTGSARTGTITVTNGSFSRTFLVQQSSGCPFAVNQSSIDFTAAGGTGSVQITAGSECSWLASANVGWISITSAPQSGNGTLTFSVQPNTTANPRSGIITVGDYVINVNQTGTATNLAGKRFDFDGDGRADASVYRNGNWYIQQSTNGFAAAQFGISSDKIVPADYDGDRKADIAVFRPADGVWYILQSSNSAFRAVQWGISTDKAVPADFNGDGKDEAVVYRSGVWYALDLSSNQTNGFQFGTAEDKPVVGDYDGDGKDDVAVFRPSNATWYRVNSLNGQFVGAQFGAASDLLVPADFNGDGKDDLAVFRPSAGAWYIARSTGVPSQNFDTVQFGQNGDVPVAADYDGDGKTDLAVFRSGNWYLLRSQAGFTGFQFGLSSDNPVPAAYVP